VDALAASSSEWRAFALADALLGGDAREATLGYVRLREQGERLAGLSYVMAQRLRDALAYALELRSGAPAASIKRKLRLPARAAVHLSSSGARGAAQAGAAQAPARRGTGAQAGRLRRPRGCGRRGTSCARRCCDAGRRA